MKTKLFFLLAFYCLFLNLTIAQTLPAASESPFYLYKTEEDFFKGNKIYRGEWSYSDGNKFYYYLPGEKKERKFSLKDSMSFYFGYSGGGKKCVRAYPKSYSLFGGGTINAYCVIGADRLSYDEDGYASGGYYYDYCIITFVDRTNKIMTENIEEFLNSKPKLLERYYAEEKGYDKKEWKKNKIATGIKYLKLFNAEK